MFAQLAALAIQQQRLLEEIQYLAFHDPLTKLANRDLFFEALGDTLLVVAAERITSCLRSHDVVARLGGDEFTVLLADVGNTTRALEIAHEIQMALSRSIEVEGVRLQLRSSIGVAVCPDHGIDEKTLMRHADIAMYQSKRTRNGACTLYLPGMLDPLMDRGSVESLPARV